ncbi:phage tail tube protein [Lachnospiraceae bacterium 54-53]
MAKVRGYQTLSGTWGEVWVDGEKIFELSKIEQKVTINREDVQIGIDVDSKATGLKGEFTLAVKKVYTRFFRILDQLRNGKDVRVQIIAKLGDPDAVGGQQERYSTDNCWFNDLPLVGWEMGKIIEQEFTGGFTPSDMVNLDQIKN